MSEVTQCRLEMKRDRIMNTTANFILNQGVTYRVALSAPNHEKMKAGFYTVELQDRANIQRCEHFAICDGNCPTASIPSVELFQLGAQDRGLNCVQSRIVAAHLVCVM